MRGRYPENEAANLFMSEPEELQGHEELARAPVVQPCSREVSRATGRAESAEHGPPFRREDGNAALVNGIWQSDGRRHCVEGRLNGPDV